VSDDIEHEPGAVGRELARGQVVEADTVFQVTDHVLELGVAAVVHVQREQLPFSVGDEGVYSYV